VADSADIEAVFKEWKERQRRPRLCRLTTDRRKLIARVLDEGWTVDDLRALITYAYEADTGEARFWRGDNDNDRRYLGIANLLRVTKVADRIETALNWREDHGGNVIHDDRGVPDGVTLDMVGMLRRRRRRSTVEGEE
jgi:hypothetical protein